MNYVGISCGFHDAALSVIDDNGNILFAGHSERYSKKKHDEKLDIGIVADAHNYITDDFEVHYYERPFVKAIRQLRAGQKLGPLVVFGSSTAFWPHLVTAKTSFFTFKIFSKFHRRPKLS